MICPMSLVCLELLELMKGRSGVALTQFSSGVRYDHSSSGKEQQSGNRAVETCLA